MLRPSTATTATDTTLVTSFLAPMEVSFSFSCSQDRYGPSCHGTEDALVGGDHEGSGRRRLHRRENYRRTLLAIQWGRRSGVPPAGPRGPAGGSHGLTEG